jgi:hypothetical protein
MASFSSRDCTNFELRVGVATVVAQEGQSAGRRNGQLMRIAVLVQIRRQDVAQGRQGEARKPV